MRDFIVNKIINDLENLIKHKISYELITGNDKRTALKLIFNDAKAADIIVNYLFQSPYNIGSTTHGIDKKKTVQNIAPMWAVFIRDDQVNTYFTITTTPVIVVDLNEFFDVFSMRKHICTIMTERYPQLHAKGAFIEYNVILNGQAQFVRIMIKNNRAYAADLLKYITYHLPHRANLCIQQEHDKFYFDLSAHEFYTYIGRVQINGIYHHHALDTLVQRLFQDDQKTQMYGPQNNFKFAVKKLLGKYCYVPQSQRFFPQQITASMLRESVARILSIDPLSLSQVDIEAVLQEKIDILRKTWCLLFKLLKRSETRPGRQFFYFHLDRIVDPGKDRTTHRMDLITNAHQKYHPLLKVWHTIDRKEPIKLKPFRLHAKRTAATLSPQALGAFHNPYFCAPHEIVILQDLKECEMHYIFKEDASTDYLWWCRSLNFDVNTLPENEKIVVNQHVPHWMNHAMTLPDLQSYNQTIQQKWETTNATTIHNELLVGFPKNLIRGIGATAETPVNRLNALLASYEAKSAFNLDYYIPVIIMISGQRYKEYSYTQRFTDILDTIFQEGLVYPSFQSLKSILNELYLHHLNKISDQGLISRAREVYHRVLHLDSRPAPVVVSPVPVVVHTPPIPVAPPIDPNMRIIIRTLNGKVIELIIPRHSTVDYLKSRIQDREGIALDQQRLISRGRQLEDDRRLADYSLTDGEIIFLVLRLRRD